MTMKSIALSLASRGYRVFPLEPNGKKPLPGSNGCKDGTRDTAQIEQWWDKYPDANVGLAPDEGMVVVDVDQKEHDGWKSLRDRSMLVPDVEHVQINTPNAGLHIYFLAPTPWANRVGVLPGVDIRADGGYLVAPGSVIDGRAYTGELPPRSELPEIAGPLLSLQTMRKERVEAQHEALVELDLPENIEKAELWLRKRAPAVEGEGGDLHTFTTAQHLREMGISQDQTLGMMIEWNERCEPPWGYDELAEKVANAYRYPSSETGSAAPTAIKDALLAYVSEEDLARAADQSEAAKRALGTGKLEDYRPGITPRPPKRPELHEYLPRQELWVHSATAKTMKTHFFMWLAACCSEGHDFAGYKFEKLGAAIYCLGEGTDSIPDRTDNIMQALELEKLENFSAFSEVPYIMRPDTLGPWYDAFDAIQERAGSVGIIVLDTARRVLSGGSISKEEDCSLLIEFGEDLARRYDCLTALLHHPGKEKGNEHRGSSLLTTDPGVVTTHDVHEGRLRLSFDLHRYKDASEIPRLCWNVHRGALGPQFEFDRKATNRKERTREELIMHGRIELVKQILTEAAGKPGAAMGQGALLDEMLRRTTNTGEGDVRADYRRFLNNVRREGCQLHDWCYKDEGVWKWAAPEENSEDEGVDFEGL